MMKLAFIYWLLFLLNQSTSELFTSIKRLEVLLKTEQVIANTLQKYITETEKNLKLLKMNFEDLKKEHNKSNQNTEEYLGNPINAFLLIKRLTLDWAEAEKLIADSTGSEIIKNLINESEESLIFPTEEDLAGAANAIIRIQDFYDLQPGSIAKGELIGRQFESQLSANDCFQIGKTAYGENNSYNAVLWMEEAMRIHKTEIKKTVDKSIVLTLLSRAYYNEKKVEKALELIDESLKINPDDEIILAERVKYEQELKEARHTEKKDERNESSSFSAKEEHEDPEFHKKLCRDEVMLEENVKARLKCRYMDFGNPFLKLAKFRVEEIFLEPRILLYHDVVSDNEIETLTNLSAPTLSRAEVLWARSNKTEYSSIRISQLSQLKDNIHPLIPILNKRVEDMTGLNTKTAESLQVLNYGIGGFFDLHYDAIKRENEFIEDVHQKNRLATVLFYISDVAQGGATVFPRIKVAIKPKKGTAAYWINLLPDGTTDFKSCHAACPILSGSKWICTKWLQEKGQEAQCHK